VKVRVARPGVSDSLIFNITRARIHVRSVEFSSLLTPTVGYVQLRTVAESSPEEMRDGINALRKQGAKSLILDLRDNPGGLLESGVELTDLFLDRDQTVVETKGRSVGSSKSYSAEDPQVWPDMPVVVLVDGNTASAAEIISGALQDHDRALIVGTPTFGKGLVQTLFQLSATEALKITTAKWYTPSGRLIQRAQNPEVRIAIAGDSTVAAKKDTVATAVFKTDGGRVLTGVGGIHPDVVVGSDSLGTAEREFARVLGSKIPAYRDAMTAYAIELKVQGAVKQESFTPTAAHRAELIKRIRAKGATVPDSVWTAVQKFIDQQFAYEAVHYSFSKAAEWRRRSADDVQVQKAVQLLQQVRTPRELIALAANTKLGATPARP
jgi:carboxyl-terminal processing protease